MKKLLTIMLMMVLLVPVFVWAQPAPAGGTGSNTTAPAGGVGSGTATPGGGTGSGPGTPGGGVGSTGNSNIFYLQNPLNSRFNSVGGLVQGFLEIFSYLVVIIAVLALIYVGLQFVLAQGKPERLKELKNWLLWIVVGVALVIGARIIVSVVINTLATTGVVNDGVIREARNGLRVN